jgi:hypothetical protein
MSRRRVGRHAVIRRRIRPVALIALLGLALVGLTGAIAATSGAYAYLTSSATATATLTESGSIGLKWNDSTGSDLSVAVGPLLPGGSEQRVADLSSTGSSAIARLQLTVAGTGTGTTSDGIQLAIDRCTVAWVASGAAYGCPGAVSSVSPDRPVQAVIDLAGSPAASPGTADHLRFTLRLPDSSPTSAQATSGTVRLTATGTTSS